MYYLWFNKVEIVNTNTRLQGVRFSHFNILKFFNFEN